MRVVVFGACTGLGQAVVTELILGGHAVTAVRAAAAPVPPQWVDRVVVRTGDPLDTDLVDELVAATEVVIDALGDCRGRIGLARAAAATTRITESMQRLGRFRYISLRPDVLVQPAGAPSPWRTTARLWELRCGPATQHRMAQAFAAVARSPLSWTVVRCPGLTAGPARGIRRIAMTRPSTAGSSLTRTDAARFLATQVRESRYICAAPLISN